MKDKTISEMLDDLKETIKQHSKSLWEAEGCEWYCDLLNDLVPMVDEIKEKSKAIPFEWLIKHIEENKEQIYADDNPIQEYHPLGVACEMVLVNYIAETEKEDESDNK